MAVATATKVTKKENQKRWDGIALAWNAGYHGKSYMPGRNELPAVLSCAIDEGKFSTATLDKDLLSVALDSA